MTIPPCSIEAWNIHRLNTRRTTHLIHHRNYPDIQANLISVISEINKFIVSTNSINNMATPFLTDTIIKSCGPHKNTRVHYDRLVDGTHATLTTNQKWAKLITKAMTINRKKKSPTPTVSKNINTITSQRRPKTKPSPRQPVLKPAHRSVLPLKVTLQPPTTTTVFWLRFRWCSEAPMAPTIKLTKVRGKVALPHPITRVCHCKFYTSC